MPHQNISLIGHAFMGWAHSNAYRQVAPFFSPRLTPPMKVICGTNAGETARAARTLGWGESSTDWEEVVARPDIDIVDICTPGDLHAPIAIAAAKAGKVVFCEKPLANTVREAERMLAAVRKARVIHMICHNYRRVPAVMLAKHIVLSGQLGELRHFRGVYLQDWITDPAFPLLWRFKKERAGSGALGDIGAYVVDLARFLMGEISEVSGDLRTFIKTRPLPGQPRKHGRVTVDDAAIAIARFANGATGTIEATRLAPGRKNANRFEINGSRGSLAFDLERMNEIELYLESDKRGQRGFRRIIVTESDHPFIKAWWPPGHIIGYEHTFTHTVYDLLEAIADDRVPEPNFVDGVRTQRVLEGIERSAKTRRWARTQA